MERYPRRLKHGQGVSHRPLSILALYTSCDSFEPSHSGHGESHCDVHQLPVVRGPREVALHLPPYGQQEQIAGDLTHACPQLHGFMMIFRLLPPLLIAMLLISIFAIVMFVFASTRT